MNRIYFFILLLLIGYTVNSSLCMESGSKHVESPLHSAVRENNISKAKNLLESKADPNSFETDTYGGTPLHFVAANNNVPIGRLLISHKADVNARCKENGQTPLHVATFRCTTAVIELLREHKADITLTDDVGMTPLTIASLLLIKSKSAPL